MKITGALKHVFMALLVLGIAAGCAGPATKEDTQAEESAVAAAERAIADAKAANEAAKAAGAEWRDTDSLIKKAEEALAAGDTAGAIRLANLAKRQAENALAQKQAEDARLAAATSMQGGSDSYTVVGGDSLWGISGKGEIYGNPYQWPLIYKANRDQIKDADLIYPGQVFAIDRAASAADIDAAVNHAKTRGAWSVGEVEQSDLDYLAR